MMKFRIANKEDFRVLSEMRWNFKLEGKDLKSCYDKDEFLKVCEEFFIEGANNKIWTHWIACDDDKIVSMVSVNHIRKVPKPTMYVDEIAYVTNVYTIPEVRGKGIASLLMDHVIKWGEEKNFELMIVWPSSRAVNFYKRKGFNGENDIMERIIRPDF